MKCQAAVLRGVGKDWEISEIDVDPHRRRRGPGAHGRSRVCHSDDHFATGTRCPPREMVELMRASGVPTPEWFPLLGGHEGADSR